MFFYTGYIVLRKSPYSLPRFPILSHFDCLGAFVIFDIHDIFLLFRSSIQRAKMHLMALVGEFTHLLLFAYKN